MRSEHDHPARMESELELPALDICVNALPGAVGRALEGGVALDKEGEQGFPCPE